jgi:hypothetical protein
MHMYIAMLEVSPPFYAPNVVFVLFIIYVTLCCRILWHGRLGLEWLHNRRVNGWRNMSGSWGWGFLQYCVYDVAQFWQHGIVVGPFFVLAAAAAAAAVRSIFTSIYPSINLSIYPSIYIYVFLHTHTHVNRSTWEISHPLCKSMTMRHVACHGNLMAIVTV